MEKCVECGCTVGHELSCPEYRDVFDEADAAYAAVRGK